MQHRFPPFRAPGGPARGWTAVELMLVVAVLGIVAGLTVPRFGAKLLPYEQVNTTGQNLVGNLRLARRLAITSRADHRLLLSPATPPYTSYTIERLGGGWSVVRGPMAIPDSVSAAGDREHRFTSLGAATATTAVTLSRTETTRTVRVLAATGRSWMEP